MGFKPGAKRPENSGRKKGTPNKKTESLLAICERRGVNPFESLLEMAYEHEYQDMRFQALKEVCQYIYPKRKAIEHSAQLDPKLVEAAEELMNMTKEEKITLLELQLRELKNDK